MENKFLLTEKEILEKQFEKDVKGYNPEEVDDFLDAIIQDYKTFKIYQNEVQEYISTLEVAVNKMKSQVRELELKNSQLSNRVSGIKEGDSVNKDNIELIQRINSLEKALYSLGYNPKDIK